MTLAAYDQFIMLNVSPLGIYCISRMPMLLQLFLFLFEHTAAIRLASHLKYMQLVVVHPLVVSVVLQIHLRW